MLELGAPFNPDYYIVLPWEEGGDPHYGGQAMPGDSGSPVFDASGQLVAITDDTSLSANGTILAAQTGKTYSAPLSTFLDWIRTNTVVTGPRLNFSAVGTNFMLTWEGVYKLQTAAAVSGPYGEIPGATSPYVYTNLTSAASHFFRLAMPEEAVPAPALGTIWGGWERPSTAQIFMWRMASRGRLRATPRIRRFGCQRNREPMAEFFKSHMSRR